MSPSLLTAASVDDDVLVPLRVRGRLWCVRVRVVAARSPLKRRPSAAAVSSGAGKMTCEMTVSSGGGLENEKVKRV